MDELHKKRRREIVILDDDLSLRQELAHFLTAHDHAVVTLADESMLDLSRLGFSDILILDFMLGAGDCTNILKLVANVPNPPHLILMTGRGESVLRATAAAAESAGLSVLGVLNKPFDCCQLQCLVESVVDHEPPSVANAISHTQIRNAVDAALERGQLPVAFQPLVAADTLAFCGAEALLAGWLPDIGPVSPIKIIEALEGDRGLITRLTEDVLRQAAVACRTWTDAGWSGAVSVNVPIEVLTQPHAVDHFSVVVRDAGLAPEQLILELTENALYDSSFVAVTALLKLHIAGFGLALDDVGQRQSGLLQLANLPVTELKIDMELIRAARSWTKGRAIFEALAELGRSLDLIVVAEGIEKAEDLALARKNRVSYIQGYLISQKCSLSELMIMLPEFSSRLSTYAALDNQVA
ncbi:EAL domain-containing protein (putative c-di-GMP-specific phosphodiesterase class I)/ActR/RegA family two-component response regulator [Amorphus suaedae]